MKRLLRVVAVVVGFVVLLVGCGSGGGGGGEPTPATKVVDADNGSITVPEQPQRIVAIGAAPGYLIDWGVQPVGVSGKEPELLEWLPSDKAQVYQNANDVGPTTQLDYEKVASLNPDLIIANIPKNMLGSFVNEDRLKAIAPTAVYFVSPPRWKQVSAGVASAAGVSAQEEQGMKAYNDVVDVFHKKYSEKTKNMQFGAVNRWDNSDDSVFTREYANSNCTLYATDVGLSIPGKPADTTGSDTDVPFEDVSMERLNDLSDLDAVMYPLGSDGKPTASVQSLLDSRGWKSARFVRQAKTLPVKCPPRNFTYSNGITTIRSLEQALDKRLGNS